MEDLTILGKPSPGSPPVAGQWLLTQIQLANLVASWWPCRWLRLLDPREISLVADQQVRN